ATRLFRLLRRAVCRRLCRRRRQMAGAGPETPDEALGKNRVAGFPRASASSPARSKTAVAIGDVRRRLELALPHLRAVGALRGLGLHSGTVVVFPAAFCASGGRLAEPGAP